MSTAAGPAVDRVAAHGTGRRLADRYTVGARRGRGPATDTHPGWDHHLDRPVTIELYRPDARPAHRYRREREVAALAGLDHPGLLTVHDRGRDPVVGRPYVVTQALDGITLAERIRRGPQPLVRVLALGGTLVGALAHLHAAGMVHRRLTPSTITLDRRVGPVLHDLDGVATLDVESITMEQALTLEAARYLAPEQIAGREVGPTADVHALARILAECLAAPAAYSGADPRLPVTPVPTAVRALLAEMADPDPERRPGASRLVGEFDALVASVQAGTLDEASPATTAATTLTRSAGPRPRVAALRTPRSPRRPRRRAAVLAALVLGLGIELATVGAGVGAPPPAHDPPAVVR